MRALERAAMFALGMLFFWFAFESGWATPKNSLDEDLEQMQGRRLIAVGFDPTMSPTWKLQHGTRGGSGENWTVVTYRTKAEADAAWMWWDNTRRFTPPPAK